MELDINTWWISFTVYTPRAGGGLQPANLLPSMVRSPSRYLIDGTRAFIEIDARPFDRALLLDSAMTLAVRSPAPRRSTVLTRRRSWIALAVWSALVAALRVSAAVPVSWRYFDQAAALAFGATRVHGRVIGLRVYELHPGFQFGPLSIVAAQGLRDLGGSHVVTVAQLALLLVGLGTLWLVLDAADGLRGIVVSSGAFFVAGATFLLEWDHLAIDTLHIDDAIALACAALAINAIARRSNWWWPALAIGAATAAKPWAIAFLPLLALVPRGRRGIASALACVVGIGVWAPFVLADPKTLLAAHYATLNASSSVLRLFGVHTPRTPRWDRLAQLGAALLLATVAVVQRRWQGVVLVALAVRILLDPSVNTYYTAGLVFGALAWDLLKPRWRWPVATVTVALLLEAPTVFNLAPTAAAIFRLLAGTGAVVAVLAPFPRSRPSRLSRWPSAWAWNGSGGADRIRREC